MKVWLLNISYPQLIYMVGKAIELGQITKDWIQLKQA
jgi:hypothetical protein